MELLRRVSVRRWVRRQPLSERPKIDEEGDLVDVLVAGVDETEVVADEEALAVEVPAVAALVEGVVLHNDPLVHPRASTDRDEAINRLVNIWRTEKEPLQHCMVFPISSLRSKSRFLNGFLNRFFTTYIQLQDCNRNSLASVIKNGTKRISKAMLKKK